MSMNKH